MMLASLVLIFCSALAIGANDLRLPGPDHCDGRSEARFCGILVNLALSYCRYFQTYCCWTCRDYNQIRRDPCSSAGHTTIADSDGYRNVSFYSSMGPFLSDDSLTTGWYRFILENGVNGVLSSTPQHRFTCATYNPMSLKIGTSLPVVGMDTFTTACAGNQTEGTRCSQPTDVRIRNCKSFFIYYLKATPPNYRYCVESA